jgi:hypothetical protein
MKDGIPNGDVTERLSEAGWMNVLPNGNEWKTCRIAGTDLEDLQDCRYRSGRLAELQVCRF